MHLLSHVHVRLDDYHHNPTEALVEVGDIFDSTRTHTHLYSTRTIVYFRCTTTTIKNETTLCVRFASSSRRLNQ